MRCWRKNTYLHRKTALFLALPDSGRYVGTGMILLYVLKATIIGHNVRNTILILPCITIILGADGCDPALGCNFYSNVL